MRYLQILALMLLGGLCTRALQAESDVKTYREVYKNGSSTERAVWDAYLSGLAAGFSWSNTQLEVSKPPREALFCVPPKLALNVENYKAMIDATLKKLYDVDATNPMPERRAAIDRESVELLLLDALIETFPCQKVKPNKK